MTYRDTNRARYRTMASLLAYLYGTGKPINPIRLAYVADKRAYRAIKERFCIDADLMGYDVVMRGEITDYKWRKIKHVRIGREAYGLIKRIDLENTTEKKS